MIKYQKFESAYIKLPHSSFQKISSILSRITLFLLALKIQFPFPNRSHFLKFKYTPRLSNPRIVLLIVNRVFRNERNSKNTHERTFPPPPLLSVSYRKVRRPKRSWLGSLSYAVFIRGGRSVPPSIKPVDSGGRWQSDAGRRCERICRGPPHFRFEPRFEQPRGSSDRSVNNLWILCTRAALRSIVAGEEVNIPGEEFCDFFLFPFHIYICMYTFFRMIRKVCIYYWIFEVNI